MTRVWSLPLSPGGWQYSDSQFLLQYLPGLRVVLLPLSCLIFALDHIGSLEWLLISKHAITFDSYGLDSSSQTSNKVTGIRESYVTHLFYSAVFYSIYFAFSFFFLLFSIGFFCFIFLYVHLASILFTSSPSHRMPSFYHLLLKRFALKAHSYTLIWKVTRNTPERCSVRSTAALLPQEN